MHTLSCLLILSPALQPCDQVATAKQIHFSTTQYQPYTYLPTDPYPIPDPLIPTDVYH